jgi:hypothetical protein
MWRHMLPGGEVDVRLLHRPSDPQAKRCGPFVIVVDKIRSDMAVQLTQYWIVLC